MRMLLKMSKSQIIVLGLVMSERTEYYKSCWQLEKKKLLHENARTPPDFSSEFKTLSSAFLPLYTVKKLLRSKKESYGKL